MWLLCPGIKQVGDGTQQTFTPSISAHTLKTRVEAVLHLIWRRELTQVLL